MNIPFFSYFTSPHHDSHKIEEYRRQCEIIKYNRARIFKPQATTFILNMAVYCYDPALVCQNGVALLESAYYASALSLFDHAIALGTVDYQVWTLRGIALVYLGRYEEALSSCDCALLDSPNHSEAWKFRGLALHGLNRYREAYLSYNRALGVVYRSPFQRVCQWFRGKLGTTNSYDYHALML